MQMYGKFEGVPEKECIVWFGTLSPIIMVQWNITLI